MFNKLLNKLLKGILGIFAIFIVMVLAGSDMIIVMELTALMEFLGAESFILMYASGLFLYLRVIKTGLQWVLKKIEKIEKHSWFCIPSKKVLSEYPPCIWFVIPTSTCLWLFIALIFLPLTLELPNIVLMLAS
ncbi:hypothetical protein OAP18_01345 [Gammaproteobacteria bacterium]|nr:hypothetical protein [Gammaproteobacteria bacterium]